MGNRTSRSIRGTTPGVEAAARELRSNRTLAEQRLWEVLKERRLSGLRFRQQHPVGPFVLDFYCPACKLAIEVDGGVHNEHVDQDGYRDQDLAAYGYRLLRFRNEEVMGDVPSVWGRITSVAETIGCIPSGMPRRRTEAT